MRKVNFFIVGAMKAGTSNLRALLVQHPEIFMSNEIAYFGGLSKNKSIDWYNQHFEASSEVQVTGDKSPNYYFYNKAAKEIYDYNPNAKLIWILREPVSRAYSDYWFSIYRGKEYQSFETAVDLELAGKRTKFRHYLYRSDYVQHVQRFLKYFNKEQMLFIELKEMYTNPVETATRCFQFLDVSATLNVQQEEELRNPTYLPKSYLLNYWNTQLFEKSFPRLRFKIRELLKSEISGYPRLNEATKNSLKKYFNPKTEELEKLTGLNLSNWK